MSYVVIITNRSTREVLEVHGGFTNESQAIAWAKRHTGFVKGYMVRKVTEAVAA